MIITLTIFSFNHVGIKLKRQEKVKCSFYFFLHFIYSWFRCWSSSSRVWKVKPIKIKIEEENERGATKREVIKTTQSLKEDGDNVQESKPKRENKNVILFA